MANTLTSLIPDVYVALDVVSRELSGFIPSVQRDPRADRCALNATLRSIATPANTSGANITPAMSIPAEAAQTIGNKTFQITKARAYSFSWQGEEQYSMDSGPGYLTIQQDQIAQAIRAAVNDMETDLAVAAYQGASRAFGTTAVTPFATNTGESAQIKKILDDNGAPMSGRSLIIDTTAGASLRTLSNLTKANEAGTVLTLRDGELLNLNGLSIKESAYVQRPTVGTGSAYVTTGTHAVGATSINVVTGSGTIVAGDVLTIGNNKYVVTTALSGGVVVIGAPGLRESITAGSAVTVNATGSRNCAFSQNAILLGTRLPALPKEGDMAIDRETITDPRTGLSFELACYPGYRMVTYQLAVCWGTAVIKPEHLAVLLG